jgi:hypothetical protein
LHYTSNRYFNFISNLLAAFSLKKVQPQMPHPGHEAHLCVLNHSGFMRSNFKEYSTLVRDPKFVCGACGRAASDKKSLCAPEEL